MENNKLSFEVRNGKLYLNNLHKEYYTVKVKAFSRDDSAEALLRSLA